MNVCGRITRNLAEGGVKQKDLCAPACSEDDGRAAAIIVHGGPWYRSGSQRDGARDHISSGIEQCQFPAGVVGGGGNFRMISRTRQNADSLLKNSRSSGSQISQGIQGGIP